MLWTCGLGLTGSARPEVCMRATLLLCLGAEGQRIFYLLPDAGDSFPSAAAALEKHFMHKVNGTACLQK